MRLSRWLAFGALVLSMTVLLSTGCSTGLAPIPRDDSTSTKALAVAAKTGSIIGTVRDANSRARMNGVTVQISSRADTTDSSGSYRIGSIPYGKLSISFSAPGYATYSRTYTLGRAYIVLATVYLRREVPPVPTPTPIPTPTPPPAPGPAPTTTELTQNEQQMVGLVNAERVANGLVALQVDMTMVRVAREHSQDMIDNNYFDHTSPTTGSPFDRLRAAGVSYSWAGENIAGNQSVLAAHTSLMNSAGHRANILNTNYTHVGIGIRLGGLYGMYSTQTFIGKR